MKAVAVGNDFENRVAYGSSDYMTCGLCAIWIELKEDSIAGDTGICPRRRYPNNRTHRDEGCRAGVLPRE